MQTVTIGIDGMSCGGCVRSITGVLQALDGVQKVDVSLENACAVVDYDPARVGIEAFNQCIEDAGFDVRA